MKFSGMWALILVQLILHFNESLCSQFEIFEGCNYNFKGS